MPQETAQASPVLVGGVQDTGDDLGDFVTSILDGYPRPQPSEDDEPEPDATSAAGDTPAEHQAQATETPVASEGASEVAAAGDTPAPGTEATPDQPVNAGQDDLSEEQFLAQTKPFTYTTDSESRTFDGFRVTSDGAGIVAPTAMKLLEQRLSQGDHYFRQSREQYEQLQRINGVAEWNYPDGRKVTGLDALREQALAGVEVRARWAVFEEAMKNPEQRTALIAGVNEQNQIVLNEAVWNSLMTRAENLSLKAQNLVTQRFNSVLTTPAAPEVLTRPQIEASAPSLVQAIATRVGATIHGDDAKRLEAILPNFIRAATAEDVRLDPRLRVGLQVIDQKFDEQVAYLASVRKQAGDVAAEREKVARQEAAAAAEAKRRNDARIANTRPTTPAPRATPAPAPVKPKTELQQRLADQDQLNQMRERVLSRAVPR